SVPKSSFATIARSDGGSSCRVKHGAGFNSLGRWTEPGFAEVFCARDFSNDIIVSYFGRNHRPRAPAITDSGALAEHGASMASG
ncbi:MAG: hypothetical protein AAF664_03750, partial [Planctomycetota bacterium]